LIDSIASWEDAFERFASKVNGQPRASVPATSPGVSLAAQEKKQMSNERVSATPGELRAALPQASSDFILACIEKGQSLAESQADYMSFLIAKTEASLAKANKPGVQAISNTRPRLEMPDGLDDMPSDDEDENPVAAWNLAVNRELKACGGNRQRAVLQANRRNPGLREAMLQAVNTKTGRR
jgi:hypothetical protein